MGYAVVFGPCCSCGLPFPYNPNRVPSVRIKGVREPVCKHCMTAGNEKRKQMGLEPHPIHPDAYEPVKEEDLQW